MALSLGSTTICLQSWAPGIWPQPYHVPTTLPALQHPAVAAAGTQPMVLATSMGLFLTSVKTTAMPEGTPVRNKVARLFWKQIRLRLSVLTLTHSA